MLELKKRIGESIVGHSSDPHGVYVALLAWLDRSGQITLDEFTTWAEDPELTEAVKALRDRVSARKRRRGGLLAAPCVLLSGGAGNRTPVPKHFRAGIYVCSLSIPGVRPKATPRSLDRTPTGRIPGQLSARLF